MASTVQPLEILARLKGPLAGLSEAEKIVSLMFPQFNFPLLRQVFADIERLFNGDYPGYRACNIKYHDLNHSVHCFLIMARLIHGAYINGVALNSRHVALGLISALMHDTGYMQLLEDETGTGGKYTISHIERSIDFLEQYFQKNGFSLAAYLFCRDCLKCTGVNVKIKEIRFETPEHELLGKILGTADLIGQMADEDYLGKLIFLYEEFKEGGVSIFHSELDLLKSTPDFWEFTKQRFASEYGNVDRFLLDHYRVRWGLDRDLDREAIERNMRYLRHILATRGGELRRGLSYEKIQGMVGDLSRLEKEQPPAPERPPGG